MKKQWKIISLAISLLLCLSVTLTACGPTQESGYTDADIYKEGKFKTVWDTIGNKVYIDDVTLKDGYKAMVTVEGKEYELGMDFLSRAMVYSTTPKPGSTKFNTATKVYDEWWKLYILRWNYLMPEIPLYSNEYYDVFSAKLNKLETSAYWGAADAIIDSSVTGTPNQAIIGSVTELSGTFRNASFGKSSPGASDLDIQKMTTGYETIVTNKDGVMQWAAENVVTAHEEQLNDDGTKTYTITIAEGLKFSDGSAINAKNYLANTMANSTLVYETVGASKSGGQSIVGWDTYSNYDGTEKENTSKEFAGLRLLGDYKFSVTITEEFSNYYYGIVYSLFTPTPMKLYLGEYDIKDDGNGCYLSAGFYTKDQDEKYPQAQVIKDNLANNNKNEIPFSGPYVVESWDSSTSTATLTKNTQYIGDHRGSANIEKIIYKKIVSETQTDQFKNGEVDVLSGLTGANDIRAAHALVQEDSTKYKESKYDRAGYGKLGFRSDFGPAMFTEVRQAVAYSIDRDYFATTFTEGFGSVVNGPYCASIGAYKTNKTYLEENMENYNVSAEAAVTVLKEGGWIYNADGTEYKDGSKKIRYKKLAKNEQIEYNLKYHSVDNKYKTVKVGDSFYMPLIINWFGTTPNEVTDLLVTSWAKADSLKTIGMEVQYTLGDFNQALYGEMSQMADYGWNGDAVYSAFNFATGFTSTIYDYSYNWTIKADEFDNYSVCYLKDAADYIWIE